MGDVNDLFKKDEDKAEKKVVKPAKHVETKEEKQMKLLVEQQKQMLKQEKASEKAKAAKTEDEKDVNDLFKKDDDKAEKKVVKPAKHVETKEEKKMKLLVEQQKQMLKQEKASAKAKRESQDRLGEKDVNDLFQKDDDKVEKKVVKQEHVETKEEKQTRLDVERAKEMLKAQKKAMKARAEHSEESDLGESDEEKQDHVDGLFHANEQEGADEEAKVAQQAPARPSWMAGLSPSEVKEMEAAKARQERVLKSMQAAPKQNQNLGEAHKDD